MPEELQVPPAPYDSAIRLVVWVGNLQSHSLGFAYDVHIDIVCFWDEEPEKSFSFVVHYALIAPTETVALQLLRVRRSVRSFRAAVASVRYSTIDFGDPRQLGYHGDTRFWYDHEEGVRHERGVSHLRPEDG